MTVMVESAEDGRAYVVRLGAEPFAVLRFEMPVDADPHLDGDYSFVGSRGGLKVSLRQFEDVDVVSLILTVEAAPGSVVDVPRIECQLELCKGHSGWGSVTGAGGFLVLSPEVGQGPVVAVGLRRGWLDDLSDARVFLPEPVPLSLFDEPDAARPGWARFAVEPVETLVAGRRAQTVLRVATYPTFQAAVADLTRGPVPEAAWGPGGPVVIDAPDLALVVPSGVEIEPDSEPGGPIEASVVNGQPGHHFAQLRGARGSHMLRLSFTPRARDLVTEACYQMLEVEPRQASSALGFLASQALVWGIAPDRDLAFDWCESTDWLVREDLLGIATTANLARLGEDRALFEDAWGSLAEHPVGLGFGLVALRTYLAGISVLGHDPKGLSHLLATRAPDDLSRLELGLIGARSEEAFEPILAGVINRLGAGQTHGHPLGETAVVAARLVGVLRLTPEGWALRAQAVDAAAQAEALLLCDTVTEPTDLLGLAWLQVGDLAS